MDLTIYVPLILVFLVGIIITGIASMGGIVYYAVALALTMLTVHIIVKDLHSDSGLGIAEGALCLFALILGVMLGGIWNGR